MRLTAPDRDALTYLFVTLLAYLNASTHLFNDSLSLVTQPVGELSQRQVRLLSRPLRLVCLLTP